MKPFFQRGRPRSVQTAPKEPVGAGLRRAAGVVSAHLRQKMPVRRAAVFCWCAAVALTGVAMLLGGVRAALTNRPDQQIAAQWSADGTRYSQVSCFFTEDTALTDESLQQARTQLQTALTEASMEPNPDARLWVDAAGFEKQAAATSDRGSATVTLTGIAGDYGLFYPAPLKSGCWMRSDDTQKDTAVLDELAAWLLFGSSDVTGRPVQIDGSAYTICGVVSLPQDSASLLTYGEKPRVWVWGESLQTDAAPGYTFYEAVLPEPTTGYGQKLLQDTFGEQTATVNHTSRYTAANLWQTLKTLSRAALRSSAVVYPWQENAALWLQTRAALLFGLQLICMIFPVGYLLVRLWLAWRRRPMRLARLVQWAQNRRQAQLQKRWMAQQAEHTDPFADLN